MPRERGMTKTEPSGAGTGHLDKYKQTGESPRSALWDESSENDGKQASKSTRRQDEVHKRVKAIGEELSDKGMRSLREDAALFKSYTAPLPLSAHL
ncbi:hypothetical protein M3J09_003434 [Ascochyta lentis]